MAVAVKMHKWPAGHRVCTRILAYPHRRFHPASCGVLGSIPDVPVAFARCAAANERPALVYHNRADRVEATRQTRERRLELRGSPEGRSTESGAIDRQRYRSGVSDGRQYPGGERVEPGRARAARSRSDAKSAHGLNADQLFLWLFDFGRAALDDSSPGRGPQAAMQADGLPHRGRARFPGSLRHRSEPPWACRGWSGRNGRQDFRVCRAPWEGLGEAHDCQ